MCLSQPQSSARASPLVGPRRRPPPRVEETGVKWLQCSVHGFDLLFQSIGRRVWMDCDS